MATSKQICVILGEDGKPIAATPFVESAQNFVAQNEGTSFVKVARIKGHSAVSLSRRENAITECIVDAAISAKLQGTSLSKFAKAHGVRYPELRDRVNAKWGYSKPWPTMRPKKKEEGRQRWNHDGLFKG